MAKIKSLKEIDVKGKVVFVRTSYDMPLDTSKKPLDPKRVRDDSRIKDTIPTLKYLVSQNAKIILEPGWCGRPKGEDPELGMAPVLLRLQELLKAEKALKHPILLTPNSLDGSKPRSVYRNKEEVKKDVSKLKEGQIIMLENVRFDAEANANDKGFAEFVASLCGKNAVYVNEAEAQNHRPEATITTVPGIIAKNGGTAVFGFKYEDVVKYIGNISKTLSDKKRGSFVFFLSGKKIETQVGITSKISVTHSLLDKMKKGDIIVIQGAVTYTFLITEEYLDAIEKNNKKMLKIIDDCNKKIKNETDRIKKEGKADSAQAITDVAASMQKEKSDKIKVLIGLTDNEIKYLIGNSFVEWKEIGEQIAFAAQVYFKAKEKGVIIITNVDHTITDKFPDKSGNLPKDAKIKIFESANGIPEGFLGVAPGPKTMEIICKNVESSSLMILAGPLSIEDGSVEKISGANQKMIASTKIAKKKGAVTIGAGGDTSAMIRKYGAEDGFTIVSNAGGATLELIEKGTLPGIKAVEDCY